MTNNLSKNKERGAVAIILALLIMGVTLSVASGISVIFVNEIKNSNLVGRSAPAFYAADAGAEYALYQIFAAASRRPSGDDVVNLFGGAVSNVCWGNSCDQPCGGAPDCISSIGAYSQTKRKIELNW